MAVRNGVGLRYAGVRVRVGVRVGVRVKVEVCVRVYRGAIIALTGPTACCNVPSELMTTSL